MSVATARGLSAGRSKIESLLEAQNELPPHRRRAIQFPSHMGSEFWKRVASIQSSTSPSPLNGLRAPASAETESVVAGVTGEAAQNLGCSATASGIVETVTIEIPVVEPLEKIFKQLPTSLLMAELFTRLLTRLDTLEHALLTSQRSKPNGNGNGQGELLIKPPPPRPSLSAIPLPTPPRKPDRVYFADGITSVVQKCFDFLSRESARAHA